MRSRSHRVARGGLSVLAAFVAGAGLLVAAPGAWAQVTITPTQSQQGGAVNLTFLVPDDRGKAYTTQVEVQMPTEAPVGEVYPLSVDNWAPTIKYRETAKPVKGIHSDTTTIARSVTWTRVVTKDPDPGSVTQLTLAMGPLPLVRQLPFFVVQTYSDNTVRRWGAQASTPGSADGAAPVLVLAPAPAPGARPTAGETAGSPGMEGMPGMESMPGMAAAAPAAPAQVAAKPFDADGPLRFFAVGLIAGVLGFGLFGAWMLRRRRSSGTTPRS